MLASGILAALLSACGSSSLSGPNGITSFHPVAQITATAKPGVPYGATDITRMTWVDPGLSPPFPTLSARISHIVTFASY